MGRFSGVDFYCDTNALGKSQQHLNILHISAVFDWLHWSRLCQSDLLVLLLVNMDIMVAAVGIGGLVVVQFSASLIPTDGFVSNILYIIKNVRLMAEGSRDKG